MSFENGKNSSGNLAEDGSVGGVELLHGDGDVGAGQRDHGSHHHHHWVHLELKKTTNNFKLDSTIEVV